MTEQRISEIAKMLEGVSSTLVLDADHKAGVIRLYGSFSVPEGSKPGDRYLNHHTMTAEQARFAAETLLRLADELMPERMYS